MMTSNDNLSHTMGSQRSLCLCESRRMVGSQCRLQLQKVGLSSVVDQSDL